VSDPRAIDDVLVTWGERLFYPRVRFRDSRTPRLSLPSGRDRAAYFRARIEATVLRRAPQVMVKVTGGGRGMKAIAAHFRYICKHGRLEMEDEFGRRSFGKEAVQEVLDEWRSAGTAIDDVGFRREAINIMLSMPHGTSPNAVLAAARAFAKTELSDHRYVMVLHDHQANPHVHLSVRAESKRGLRLNPRKVDLHRWREVFAEKLRHLGIDAEATRHESRGQIRTYPPLWRLKAADGGRSVGAPPGRRSNATESPNRREAAQAWREIAVALSASAAIEDQRLAASIGMFVAGLRETDHGENRQPLVVHIGRSMER
jgi:hypothetical protein